MKTVFFAWLSNNFRDTIIDFQGFYKSFIKFHPDIDLVIFDDPVISKVFGSEPWINSCTCKSAFAKLLYNDYDLVVNVDADFYFFDRCEDILKGDYDFACCSNYNQVYNVRLAHANENLKGYNIPDVDEVCYVQGGLVASTSKEFWDDYYKITGDLESYFELKENDTLNILYHSGKYKTKLLEGDYRFDSPNFTQFYNCSSLGKEKTFIVKDDKVYCENKPVKSYHVAYGNAGPHGFRKPRPDKIFSTEVADWLKDKIKDVA